MDHIRLRPGRKPVRHFLYLTIALALATAVLSPDQAFAQPKRSVRWSASSFLLLESDTAASSLIWRLDTVQVRYFFSRVVDSILAANPPSGWDSDSADALLTTGNGRVINVTLLSPGTDGDILTTAAGAPFWTATPTIADRASQFFYWSSITHGNAADTANDKHVAYIGQLSREWPVPHGATWSALTANFYLRDGDLYQGYSATMTVNGGGAGSIVAGDKLLLRFFPGGNSSISKYVKLYRIPAGFHWIGTGVTNKVYGEYIGYWLIDGAKFSSTTTTVSLECELTLKVK